MSEQIADFLAGTPWASAKREPLAGDASARRYERLYGPGGTAVLMIAPPADGTAFDRFVKVADWLRAAGFSSPMIEAANRAQGLLLLEDFGDGVMADLAQESSAAETTLYEAAGEVVAELARSQPPAWLSHLDAGGLTTQLKLAFDEMPDRALGQALWPDAAACARELLDALPGSGATHISLRDLHAQNIIWLPEREGLKRVGLLDFQDAVLAPEGYDLASLIDDPRRAVPLGLRARIISTHAAVMDRPVAEMRQAVNTLSLVRNMRILGIFRRAARDRARPAYLDYLPRTAALVAQAADQVAPAALRYIINRVLAGYGLAAAA
ncbi:MAG: phosphotransferase [Pseudomonadota bacterium]